MFFFQFPCFSSRFIRFSTWISFFLIYKFHEKVKCLEYLKLCRLFLLFFAFMSSSYSSSSSSAQHVQLGFYRFGVAVLWTRNVKWKLSRVEYGELVIIIHKIFSEFGILMNGGVFWKEKDQTCFDKPNRAATLLALQAARKKDAVSAAEYKLTYRVLKEIPRQKSFNPFSFRLMEWVCVSACQETNTKRICGIEMREQRRNRNRYRNSEPLFFLNRDSNFLCVSNVE